MENWEPVNPDDYQKPVGSNAAVTVLAVVLLTLGAVTLLGWLFLAFMWQVLTAAMRAA